MAIDYYKILGVTPESTQNEIDKAYRLLIRNLHPDVAAPQLAFLASEVNSAYEVLKNPTLRAQYDDQLNAALSENYVERKDNKPSIEDHIAWLTTTPVRLPLFDWKYLAAALGSYIAASALSSAVTVRTSTNPATTFPAVITQIVVLMAIFYVPFASKPFTKIPWKPLVPLLIGLALIVLSAIILPTKTDWLSFFFSVLVVVLSAEAGTLSRLSRQRRKDVRLANQWHFFITNLNFTEVVAVLDVEAFHLDGQGIGVVAGSDLLSLQETQLRVWAAGIHPDNILAISSTGKIVSFITHEAFYGWARNRLTRTDRNV